MLNPSGFPLSAPASRTLVWGVMALALCAGAWAEKADRQQPLVFAADAARVDEARRLNVLSGNVEITKGTMVVRADQVEVRQNPNGTQSATATGGPGGRAYFRQKREGLSEFIEGEAERVVYDGTQDTVQFVGRATMRRLSGSTVTDQVSGATITYDSRTGVFQVLGGTPGASGSRGRVQGVIAPRSEPEGASR